MNEPRYLLGALFLLLLGWLIGVASMFEFARSLDAPTYPDDCESVVLDDSESVDADVVAALEELDAARERTRALYSVALTRARELIVLLEGELAECEAAKVKP